MSSPSFDDQLKVLDAVIEREEAFVRTSAQKYHSGFIAKKRLDIEALKASREIVRQARQDKQMTGMNGKRIE